MECVFEISLRRASRVQEFKVAKTESLRNVDDLLSKLLRGVG